MGARSGPGGNSFGLQSVRRSVGSVEVVKPSRILSRLTIMSSVVYEITFVFTDGDDNSSLGSTWGAEDYALSSKRCLFEGTCTKTRTGTCRKQKVVRLNCLYIYVSI